MLFRPYGFSDSMQIFALKKHPDRCTGRFRPDWNRRTARIAALIVAAAAPCAAVHAQQDAPKQLEPVVVSASRTEQRVFDAPAAIDAVPLDPFRTASPLVNLSEVLPAVPGLQIRNRENYAQDLQISMRGFGTRSTFGVRGVRILIDGIPATMPDGQGQASTASLASAKRIEVLRGPAAQLYGNAAGGVLQVFTKDPPTSPDDSFGSATLGAGSYGQRQIGVSAGTGTETLGALFDVSHYATDGYRQHSAAKRTHLNAKLVAHPSGATTLTGVLNVFDQPNAQDPLGLTHAAFDRDPRQAVSQATDFDTRKSVQQQQTGLVLEHKLSADDTVSGRVYAGTRKIRQMLAFSGAAATSSGGVIDLDRDYGGVGLQWTRKQHIDRMRLNWTVGIEADGLRETRRGYVNNAGTSGALRRDENDRARNLDLYGQIDWTFTPQWQAVAGVRMSRVRFTVDDHYITAANPDDSGRVTYRNTSPVIGLVWHAADHINLYANLGTGFETPTLAETAYRAGGTGPNLSLRASKSLQGEIGIKLRIDERHAIDVALFDARSKDEIVPLTVESGRTIFQNVDGVRRRGAELAIRATRGKMTTRVGYTWLDARFRESFVNGQNIRIAAGNRLPGVPMHSLFGDLEYRPIAPLSIGLEVRAESKAYVNDVNSDAAPGYAVLNLRAGIEFNAGAAKMFLFGRIDNVLDRNYAGSVIVNDGNGRFFEPAAGRRLFIGLRTVF